MSRSETLSKTSERSTAAPTASLGMIVATIIHGKKVATEAYGRLRAGLRFSEEDLHAGLLALLKARDCDHDDCRCALRKASEDVRRAVAAARVGHQDETELLAQTLVSLCRNVRRKEKRHNQREQLVSPSHDGQGGVVLREPGDAPVNPGLLCNLCESILAPLESENARPVYRTALNRLFVMSKCSEAQREAYFTINSRDGRKTGLRIDNSMSRAASVALGKVSSYAVANGFFGQEDFEAAIEDHYFDQRNSVAA